jgi:hypothetical protein
MFPVAVHYPDVPLPSIDSSRVVFADFSGTIKTL